MGARRSETTDEMLRDYGIGEKVRALRLRKKMGLVELGEHTGFSPGLLSKIERSLVWPPLSTLLRIAMVFGVGLDYFFAEDGSRHTVAIVRSADRKTLPFEIGDTVSYHFESLDYPATERKTNAWLAEFESIDEDTAEPHSHDGSEFIYLISGKLAITIGRERHELDADDSIYFDSVVPHWYTRLGVERCRAVVVTAA